MATAVTVVFGANSTQFQAELARMQTMTQAAATRMASSSAGHIQGMSSLIREGITIPREVLEGRGMGRIIASMSIFVSALSSVISGTEKAESYASQLAAGYERLALQANLAAAAALKKAEASAADAYAEGLEDEATIAAAEADALKSKTAQANALAAQEKAVAAREAATAEEMEAVAAGEATAASLPLLAIFIGVVIVLAALYGAYKLVTAIIHYHNEATESSQKAAYNATLNFNEEAAALEKLKDAALKTEEALAKLNERHDDYAKRASAYLDALKEQARAQEELTDTQTKGKLLDIELREKTGKISHEEAVKQKADFEVKAAADKAAAKTAELLEARDAAAIMAQKASAAAAQDQVTAQAASDKINKSPEGIANAERLAQLEKIKKETAERISKLGETAASSVGKDRLNALGELGTQQAIANYAQFQIDSLKGDMRPDEIAATEALRIAGESASAAKSISADHEKALSAWAAQMKASPSQVAAEQANIRKQEQLDLLSTSRAGGFQLNSQQYLGAYVSAPAGWTAIITDIHGIRENTSHLVPQSNRAPGARSPQYSGSPSHGHK